MSSSIVSTATVSGETWCTPSEWKSREQKNSLHVQFDRLEVALSFTRDSVMLTSIIIRSNANANVACAFKFVVQLREISWYNTVERSLYEIRYKNKGIHF
ncbi:uncharacterized protein LOC128285662 isoform X3 [Gossypium arboreum]|uniref:uncharacterized protein LOC128285662 isoform X3 n=1 Tax=Gossypium arboreum TaxID=29729 RepID=UPI0022F1B929|nr:uncharacterized protein LOC128285662 isoform X3 [Gossypium arboreum]